MSKAKPRILLIEDDLELTQAYKVRLNAEGFDVRVCPDGQKALHEALDYQPNLILLDIMMPGVSGFDVLGILRRNPATVSTKIIILTALSQLTDRQRAKDLGADEFLVKSQAIMADVVGRIRFHLGLLSPDTAE